jgi:hypothetical protein
MPNPTPGHDAPMVLVIILVFLVAFLGIAVAAYSRRGSDISAHPRGEESDVSAPGAATDPQ